MNDKHPYMSGSGGLVQAINHLRRSFPAQVTADTLKKLGIAPNNETYVLNILRFVGLLDEEGKKVAKAEAVFAKHDDAEFQKGFGEMIETAYSDLFGLHGKDAWTLSVNKLISYFRSADRTSAIVGQRQASTFQTLAGLSGHGEPPAAKGAKGSGTGHASTRKVSPPRPGGETPVRPARAAPPSSPAERAGNVGLTVRIEINLPVAPDQETYDRIFKSIRESLLSGE